LLETLVAEEVNFVIRLKVGSNFCDQEGKPVALSVSKGETRPINKVFYKGKAFVNVIGTWQKGFAEPMWIMTNLKVKEGLAIYQQRMKIEQTFRDLKNLLNFHKLMNKRRIWMEKMVALVLIAYAIALILGETLRSFFYPANSRKNKLFSGVFVFLKYKPDIPQPILSQANSAFAQLVVPVQTPV
jgi:hypothetical protein